MGRGQGTCGCRDHVTDDALDQEELPGDSGTFVEEIVELNIDQRTRRVLIDVRTVVASIGSNQRLDRNECGGYLGNSTEFINNRVLERVSHIDDAYIRRVDEVILSRTDGQGTQTWLGDDRIN